MASRIIFVPGIMTVPELQEFQWGKAAREMFPNRDIVVLSKKYLYPQHKMIGELRDELIDHLQDGVPTTLVGHSFGGVVATAALAQMQRDGTPTDHIVKLVTLASPHNMQAPGLEEARTVLGYSQDIQGIPVFTYGARFDHVVPRRYTMFPGSQHETILSTHSGFWLNPRSWRYRHVWNCLRD